MSAQPEAAPAAATLPGSTDAPATESEKSPAQKKVRRTKIKWDEETIKEHDKLRGTRMKIDEPDTPFNADYNPSEDEEETAGTGKAEVLPEKRTVVEHGEPPTIPKPKTVRVHVDIAGQMGALEQSLKQNPKSKWESDAAHDPTTADEEEKRRKREIFNKKRAAHYNMKEQLRLAREANLRELAEEEAAEKAAREAAASANAIANSTTETNPP